MFVGFFFSISFTTSPFLLLKIQFPPVHGCIVSCRVAYLFYEGIDRNITVSPQSCHYCWVPEGSGAVTLSEVADQLRLEFLVEVKYAMCEKIHAGWAARNLTTDGGSFYFFFPFKDPNICDVCH